MTDSFTAELFDFASEGPRVVFPGSQLTVDPERSVDDASEAMMARGMGSIYTTTSRATPMRSASKPHDQK